MAEKTRTAGKYIGIVLSRAVNDALVSTPEAKMRIAVIKLALIEADKSPAARSFFTSSVFYGLCGLLGIDKDYARELIRDHALWVSNETSGGAKL